MSSSTSISVVTATWNCMQALPTCLASLHGQTHKRWQHVVVDGGSTDGTLEVLAQQRAHIDVLISEPDQGIYDALNKGISKSTGDVVGFLHADDFLADEAVLARIAAAFEDPRVQAVYGDLDYVRKAHPDQIVRHWRAGEFDRQQLGRGWMPPHPTLYVRRHWYAQLGGFDLNYRIAADYDSVLRLFSNPGFETRYIPEVLVRMRVGGASNRSLAAIWRKSREDLHALRKNAVGGWLTLLLKNTRKVRQFGALGRKLDSDTTR